MAKIVTPLKARKKFDERLFGMFLKPLRMFCDCCGKFLPSDLEWQCGYCDAENLSTKIYSFLNKCKTCKRAPRAIKCPHCREILFLTLPEDGSHFARKIGDALPPILAQETVAEEAHQQKVRDLERKKFEIEREITLTRLNNELAQLKKAFEVAPTKTVEEDLEESCRQHQTRTLAVDVILRREKALNAERYKDDEEFLEKANQSLDWWHEQQSLRP